MKSREKLVFLLSSVFMIFKGLLLAQENHTEDPRKGALLIVAA